MPLKGLELLVTWIATYVISCVVVGSLLWALLNALDWFFGLFQ